MNKRNARHNGFGGIDLEIEHPVYGWIPFTADAGDVERSGQEIYGEILLDDAIEIAEYVPPAPPTTEDLEESVRLQRDALLTESDWSQAADVPTATQMLWRPYRQALRDIPEQKGFPETIEWPNKPISEERRRKGE